MPQRSDGPGFNIAASPIDHDNIRMGVVMNNLEWIAWPLVAVALALVFRHGIADVLGRFRRLKWKDLELVFDAPALLPARSPSSWARELLFQLAATAHDLGKSDDAFQRSLRARRPTSGCS
ncbi:MAG: hypothetical protein ACREXU_03610 [Gammaproteobacteria bacterium]